VYDVSGKTDKVVADQSLPDEMLFSKPVLRAVWVQEFGAADSGVPPAEHSMTEEDMIALAVEQSQQQQQQPGDQTTESSSSGADAPSPSPCVSASLVSASSSPPPAAVGTSSSAATADASSSPPHSGETGAAPSSGDTTTSSPTVVQAGSPQAPHIESMTEEELIALALQQSVESSPAVGSSTMAVVEESRPAVSAPAVVDLAQLSEEEQIRLALERSLHGGGDPPSVAKRKVTEIITRTKHHGRYLFEVICEEKDTGTADGSVPPPQEGW
jgi:hypothetical protein